MHDQHALLVQIDLRSDYERRHDGLGLLLKNARVVRAGRHKAVPTLKARAPHMGLASAAALKRELHLNCMRPGGVPAQAKMEGGLPATRPLSVETDLTVHHLSLLEKARYYKHFVGSLPFASAASIVFWSLCFNQPRAIRIAMKCVPLPPPLLPQLWCRQAHGIACQTPALYVCTAGYSTQAGKQASCMLACDACLLLLLLQVRQRGRAARTVQSHPGHRRA